MISEQKKIEGRNKIWIRANKNSVLKWFNLQNRYVARFSIKDKRDPDDFTDIG